MKQKHKQGPVRTITTIDMACRQEARGSQNNALFAADRWDDSLISFAVAAKQTSVALHSVQPTQYEHQRLAPSLSLYGCLLASYTFDALHSPEDSSKSGNKDKMMGFVTSQQIRLTCSIKTNTDVRYDSNRINARNTHTPIALVLVVAALVLPSISETTSPVVALDARHIIG